jgi:hypothetical protein
VDEGTGGFSCPTGQPGQCSTGITVCENGGLRCQLYPGPSAEICDNRDNDCDGAVDEGFGVGAPCDGPDGDLCNEGFITCAGDGSTVCTDNSPDNLEVCGDRVDNDCNGEVDESCEPPQEP